MDESGASDNVHSTPNAIVLKRGFKRMFRESRRRQRGCAAGGTRLGDEGLRKVTVATRAHINMNNRTEDRFILLAILRL